MSEQKPGHGGGNSRRRLDEPGAVLTGIEIANQAQRKDQVRQIDSPQLRIVEGARQPIQDDAKIWLLGAGNVVSEGCVDIAKRDKHTSIADINLAAGKANGVQEGVDRT